MGAHVVNLPVDFHNKAQRQTAEVDDVRPDRVLTAELQALRPQAQRLPQQSLGQRLIAAQLAGAVNDRALRGGRAPTPALRAVPLPVPGRNVLTFARAASFWSQAITSAPLASSASTVARPERARP